MSKCSEEKQRKQGRERERERERERWSAFCCTRMRIALVPGSYSGSFLQSFLLVAKQRMIAWAVWEAYIKMPSSVPPLHWTSLPFDTVRASLSMWKSTGTSKPNASVSAYQLAMSLSLSLSLSCSLFLSLAPSLSISLPPPLLASLSTASLSLALSLSPQSSLSLTNMYSEW